MLVNITTHTYLYDHRMPGCWIVLLPRPLMNRVKYAYSFTKSYMMSITVTDEQSKCNKELSSQINDLPLLFSSSQRVPAK